MKNLLRSFVTQIKNISWKQTILFVGCQACMAQAMADVGFGGGKVLNIFL